MSRRAVAAVWPRGSDEPTVPFTWKRDNGSFRRLVISTPPTRAPRTHTEADGLLVTVEARIHVSLSWRFLHQRTLYRIRRSSRRSKAALVLERPIREFWLPLGNRGATTLAIELRECYAGDVLPGATT